MSRHRTAVAGAVEDLRHQAAGAVDPAVLEHLRSEAGAEFVVDLLSIMPTLPPAAESVARRVRDAFAAHPIEELRHAEVGVAPRFGTRTAVCLVEGRPPAERELVVAQVRIRARIVTRWVDMRSEAERCFEWPVTLDAGAAAGSTAPAAAPSLS